MGVPESATKSLSPSEEKPTKAAMSDDETTGAQHIYFYLLAGAKGARRKNDEIVCIALHNITTHEPRVPKVALDSRADHDDDPV